MAVYIVPQEDIRPNFYDFISEYLSPRLDVGAFSKFMQEYMNGNESVKIRPRMTSIDYIKHLYKLQLINPRNLDCVFNYAIYTGDHELREQINLYYRKVGGRAELLIPVKFNPLPL